MNNAANLTYKTIDNKNIEVNKGQQLLGTIYLQDNYLTKNRSENGSPQTTFFFKKDNTVKKLRPEDNLSIAIKLLELENC